MFKRGDQPKAVKSGDSAIINLITTKPVKVEPYHAAGGVKNTQSGSTKSGGKKSRLARNDGGVYLYFPSPQEQMVHTANDGLVVRDEWVRELLRKELQEDIFAYFGL